jgi:hypothetical protein
MRIDSVHCDNCEKYICTYAEWSAERPKTSAVECCGMHHVICKPCFSSLLVAVLQEIEQFKSGADYLQAEMRPARRNNVYRESYLSHMADLCQVALQDKPDLTRVYKHYDSAIGFKFKHLHILAMEKSFENQVVILKDQQIS